MGRKEIKVPFDILDFKGRAFIDPADFRGLSREEIERGISEAIDEAGKADITFSADNMEQAITEVMEAIAEIEREEAEEEAELAELRQ